MGETGEGSGGNGGGNWEYGTPLSTPSKLVFKSFEYVANLYHLKFCEKPSNLFLLNVLAENIRIYPDSLLCESKLKYREI